MMIDHLPVDEVVAFLRHCAEEERGLKGAVYGAGLGAVMSIAGRLAHQREVDVKAVLSNVLVGAAYGAADQRHLRS